MAKKKKGPTLAYQLRSSINDNFQEGKSKRAAKMSDGGYGSAIYSHSHRKDLVEFSTQFANFCKENYRIKQAKDITSEHAKAFMEHKAKTCADTTLKTYHQHLNKLSKCLNATFSSCNANLTSGWEIPAGANQTKLRSVKIERDNMNKVLDKLDFKHATHRAIALAEALGLRAHETVKVKGNFIDLNRGVVTVIGKGGRLREITIREDRKELLTEFKEKYSNCRIAPVKSDSVNATFKRICKREDVDDLEGSKSGIHAVRKLWATELLEEKIDQGMAEKDAWADVSELLGHGRNRPDLFKVYVVR